MPIVSEIGLWYSLIPHLVVFQLNLTELVIHVTVGQHQDDQPLIMEQQPLRMCSHLPTE